MVRTGTLVTDIGVSLSSVIVRFGVLDVAFDLTSLCLVVTFGDNVNIYLSLTGAVQFTFLASS